MTSTPCPQSWLPRPQLACAWSEVFDKMSILRLKRDRLADAAGRANVARELAAVEAVVGDIGRFPSALGEAVRELVEVNGALWDIEDGLRACEASLRFDAVFVALARSVYRENDRRACLKRHIDRLLGSDLVAEKSHATVA